MTAIVPIESSSCYNVYCLFPGTSYSRSNANLSQQSINIKYYPSLRLQTLTLTLKHMRVEAERGSVQPAAPEGSSSL